MAQPLRVLIVEDSVDDADLAVAWLRRDGFDPDWQRVETEAEFLAALDDRLDLVLSDYKMPEFSGPRALELLKQRAPDVPFILFSGNIGEGAAVAAIKAGATDYLLKDRLTRLGSAVRSALEERRLRRERRRSEEVHQQAIESLRESEARFREMAENMEVVFWVADPENPQKLYLSPAYATIWGRSCESACQSPHAWLEAVHPEDRARVLLAVQTKQARGAYDEEYRLIRPDGAERRIHDRAFPVRDADGVIRRWVGVAEDITVRKQGETDLQVAQWQLRALVGRLHTAREDEAKRISRELHDDLGQQLTALNLELGILEGALPGASPPQREQFVRMHTIVNHTVGAVQRIAGELRLGHLEILGLTAAIEWHLKEFSRRSAIPCRLTRLDEVADLSDRRSTALFRILQEALTNIVRHAGATEVAIDLHRGPAEVTLSVHDNGRGITAGELRDEKSIGLLGMRERIQLVGGRISISGGAGAGTTVVAAVPLRGSDGDSP